VEEEEVEIKEAEAGGGKGWVGKEEGGEVLLAQLSRHRGGAVALPARRWRPCCSGCPSCLVFRRVERRVLFVFFSFASPLLSARCARADRSAPGARCSGTVLAAPRTAPPAAPPTAPRTGTVLSAPRLQSA